MNLTSVAPPCGSIRLKILGSDLNPHEVWEATEVTKPAEPGLKPLVRRTYTSCGRRPESEGRDV